MNWQEASKVEAMKCSFSCVNTDKGGLNLRRINDGCGAFYTKRHKGFDPGSRFLFSLCRGEDDKGAKEF